MHEEIVAQMIASFLYQWIYKVGKPKEEIFDFENYIYKPYVWMLESDPQSVLELLASQYSNGISIIKA